MSKPELLYRLSKDGSKLYLRVPDTDTEKDRVLMFNRAMADFGFSEPKDIFSERLGVAVAPRYISFRKDNHLVKLDLFQELGALFTMRKIPNVDWYCKRF